MEILYVVIAWTPHAKPPQIQLCGAYRHSAQAVLHIEQAQARNPHLTFDMRICPFPE